MTTNDQQPRSPEGITHVNFTYALDGGMWVRRQSGRKDWISFDVLSKEIGGAEVRRLQRIAHGGGFTGIWYSTTPSSKQHLRR